MKLEETIARRLGEARKAAGLSQQALGVAAGIEEETAKVRIHQYEHAKHVPPYSMLERLAEVLGKPVTWFICQEDEKELVLELEAVPRPERAKMLASALELLKNRTTESR
jgi:transcriptional regulator with XRE-family HTH domain